MMPDVSLRRRGSFDVSGSGAVSEAARGVLSELDRQQQHRKNEILAMETALSRSVAAERIAREGIATERQLREEADGKVRAHLALEAQLQADLGNARLQLRQKDSALERSVQGAVQKGHYEGLVLGKSQAEAAMQAQLERGRIDILRSEERCREEVAKAEEAKRAQLADRAAVDKMRSSAEGQVARVEQSRLQAEQRTERLAGALSRVTQELEDKVSAMQSAARSEVAEYAEEAGRLQLTLTKEMDLELNQLREELERERSARKVGEELAEELTEELAAVQHELSCHEDQLAEAASSMAETDELIATMRADQEVLEWRSRRANEALNSVRNTVMGGGDPEAVEIQAPDAASPIASRTRDFSPSVPDSLWMSTVLDGTRTPGLSRSKPAVSTPEYVQAAEARDAAELSCSQAQRDAEEAHGIVKRQEVEVARQRTQAYEAEEVANLEAAKRYGSAFLLLSIVAAGFLFLHFTRVRPCAEW